MARRTKIIATVGPASDDPVVIRQMIEAGVDVFRIGLAHGSLSDAVQRYRSIREIAAASDRVVGILADLPGPKVRLGQFEDGGVALVPGSTVVLRPGDPTSTSTSLGVDYLDLLVDLQPGDSVALGDGTVRLTVTSFDATQFRRRFVHALAYGTSRAPLDPAGRAAPSGWANGRPAGE